MTRCVCRSALKRPRQVQRYRSMKEIMEATKHEVVVCSKCGSGNNAEQIRVHINSWCCPNFADRKSLISTDVPESFMIENPISSATVSPQGKRRRRAQRYGSMKEIMEATKNEVVICCKCGFGNNAGRIRVPINSWHCPNCTDEYSPHSKNSRKQKRRTCSLVHRKKSRSLLPYTPSKHFDQRLQQIQSLTSVQTSLDMEFSNDLTYPPGMAPESANKADLENGGVPVLSNGDIETYNKCRAMAERGEYPPLRIVHDHYEGYTIEADDPITDMTLIAEYTGEVDYIKNREQDDSDSMMTLLLATNPDESMVICTNKRGNISRFISGINNILESRKRENVKCVRYDVNGVCRNLLVVTRHIAKGERLYLDYNGHENEYPTHYFV